mgnify:FL=1
MVKGVIFDMDGTMFDTERLSTKGWIYAGKKLGVDILVALTDSFRGKKSTGDPKKICSKFWRQTGLRYSACNEA